MTSNPKDYSGFWMIVSFALAAWFTVYVLNEPKRIVKAIKNHQLDRISVNDSIYVIDCKIDTVLYEPTEHDAPERP